MTSMVESFRLGDATLGSHVLHGPDHSSAYYYSGPCHALLEAFLLRLVPLVVVVVLAVDSVGPQHFGSCHEPV